METVQNEKIKIYSRLKRKFSNDDNRVRNNYLFPSHAYIDNNSRIRNEIQSGKENWILKIKGWSFLQKQRENFHWLTNVSQYVFNKKNQDETGKERTDECLSYFLDLKNNKNVPIKIEYLKLMTQDEVTEMMRDRINTRKNIDILKLYMENNLAYNDNSKFSFDSNNNNFENYVNNTKITQHDKNTKKNEITLMTSKTGHFDGKLALSLNAENILKSNLNNKYHNYLKIKAENTVGIVELISKFGQSVISDIDDTIRETYCIKGKKAVFLSTFINEWNPVQGMSDIYLNWYLKGLSFHYVSASPWQLYPMLENFLQVNNFPPGSFHLKLMSMSQKSKLFQSPQQSKIIEIKEILNSYPQRKFILVGDSGQLDIELYSQIAMEHPNQISIILIRNVHESDKYGELLERCYEAFRHLPSNIKYIIFNNSYELLENRTLTNIVNTNYS